MQELGVPRGLEDTHLWGVLVGRRRHCLGGHHRQSWCRGDMVHPAWDSHREPAGRRTKLLHHEGSFPPEKNPPEREGKERRKGEVTLLTQALRSTTQPPGETQGDLMTLIML